MNTNRNQDELRHATQARRWGGVATALYIVVIGCALWFTRCDCAPPLDEELESGSILIAFGESPVGRGEQMKSEAEAKPQVVEPTPAVEPTPPTPTDESSEVEQPVVEEVEQVEEVVAPQREVDARALFPGSKKAEDEGRGESKEDGVRGSDRGTMDDASSLLGGGLAGDFNLAGRSLVGRLPQPNYEEQVEGRVVLNIVVDEMGVVREARLDPTSSTTNNSRLIEAAQEAARRAQFTKAEEFNQVGTITYIFTLN